MDPRLNLLLDTSNDFFCVVDKTGTIKHTNLSFRNALGYSEADLTGKNATSLTHPADIKKRGELLKTITPNQQITVQESRVKAKNGRYFNVKWFLTLSKENGLIYAIGINLTTTEDDKNTLPDNFQQIIQSFIEGIVTVNKNWEITSFNPSFLAITDLGAENLKNSNFKELLSLGLTTAVITELETAVNNNTIGHTEYLNQYFNRWLRINIYPNKNDIMVFIRDITYEKTQQLVLALEKNVLELNAAPNHTLQQTINQLLKGIEAIFPEMICSVLEVNDEQDIKRLYHIAGPRLPHEYCDAINGTPIGPNVGSCGSAAYHRSQVIVTDIETDPLWDDFRHLILPYGLKACWSTPIINAQNLKVLATFAVYYKEMRKPKSSELQMIERTSNILRILFENKRNEEHVQNQNKLLQEIASISSHEIRRPVATLLGLVNLFDKENANNPLNKEIISHIEHTTKELDSVIHTIVKKTIYLKSEE